MAKEYPGKEHSERLENGLTAIQNARLERQATKENWRKVKRWDTDSKISELVEKSNTEELTLKEKALVALHGDIMHPDPRVRRIATGNAIAMEKQNQSDDHFELKQTNGRSEDEINEAIEAEIGSQLEGVADNGQAATTGEAAGAQPNAPDDADDPPE